MHGVLYEETIFASGMLKNGDVLLIEHRLRAGVRPNESEEVAKLRKENDRLRAAERRKNQTPEQKEAKREADRKAKAARLEKQTDEGKQAAE